jgi:hypothetical protein
MKINLWKNIIHAFSLFKYEMLSKKSIEEGIKYFFILITIMLTISLLLSTKNFLEIPNSLKTELSKVEEFKIDIDYNSSEPLYFPSKNPYLSIVNNISESKGKLVIYDGELLYKPLPFITKNISFHEYNDLKQSSSEVAKIFGIILILILPTLLIYLYAYHIIRYFIIALIISLVAKIILLITRKRIKYKRLFSATLFSLTPLIILERLITPFYSSITYILLILYVIWYILVCVELVEEF